MKTIEKIEKKEFDLSDNEILELLRIDTNSHDFYRLLSVSNELSRSKFNNKGYVFTQIGINAEPCSINCRFCSLGADHYSLDSKWEKDVDSLKEELIKLNNYKFDDFFLMTTADYSIDKFLSIAQDLKPLLKENQKFIANIGDFDFEIAKRLKSTGFTGVYHINRLREGQDTLMTTNVREQSIEAVQKAGLEIYYCIEPIGPEHSYEELLVEIKRARDLNISVMAVMRRIPVKGTPLEKEGQITAIEMTKIAAVTNIVVNPSRSMNVHEPTQMSLLAGINQLYAELGANPRDIKSETEKSRGFTPKKAWEMLWEGGYNK
ncbi:MAG: radical SAM protein [Bacteroidales bacterium]|nr:MAG: radical SAM protein [Bacteroidales bacterium]